MDFEFASWSSDDDYMERQDEQGDAIIAIGRVDGSVFVIVYAWQAGLRRIIFSG